MCIRKEVKDNAGKSEVMVLNGEKGLECDVRLYGMRLLHVSEFTYLRLVSDESGRNDAVLYKGGKLQVLLGPLLTLGICSLSVLGSYMRHYLRLF